MQVVLFPMLKALFQHFMKRSIFNLRVFLSTLYIIIKYLKLRIGTTVPKANLSNALCYSKQLLKKHSVQ